MAVSPKRNAVMLLNNTTLKPLNYHSVSVSDTRRTFYFTHTWQPGIHSRTFSLNKSRITAANVSRFCCSGHEVMAFSLAQPHKRKLHGVGSGRCGGHSIVPPRPIHWVVKYYQATHEEEAQTVVVKLLAWSAVLHRSPTECAFRCFGFTSQSLCVGKWRARHAACTHPHTYFCILQRLKWRRARLWAVAPPQVAVRARW
jgi:hypothetical protein